jgi:pyrroline-5-carboxylate reductase
MGNLTLGIIGLGTMGGILANSLLKNNFDAFTRYVFYDIEQDKLQPFSNMENVVISDSIPSLVEQSDFILLAVKPYIMEKVVKEIVECNYDEKVMITIAAGLKIGFYRDILGDRCYINRVMPNILFSVGEGCAGITMDPKISEEFANIVQGIFKLSGKVILVEEKNMDVVTALIGSGPAYIFMTIEALADGAVRMGLPRKDAYMLASQMIIGAGKMVLQKNTNPGVLKDKVCTPGGTTIEAISVLERGGLRSLFIDAIEAATKKSQSLNSK